MKPKIALILDISFTKRDYKRFGISTLRKKFNVFIFDFTQNFSKSLSKLKFAKKIYKCRGYYSVKNINEFKKILKKTKLSNCINYISNKSLEYKLVKILEEKKVPLIKIQNGLVIGPEDPRSFMQKLHILFLKFTNKKRFNAFLANQFNKIKNKFIKKKPKIVFDKVVIGGKIGLKDPAIGLNTKVIYAHSLDYDNYLINNKTLKSEIKKPYAVFIDQNLPFHPDATKFFRVDPRCTPKKYYPALNNFFNIIEERINMEMIICAHPKSDYENNPNYLYGRKFIKNKTINLIKNSSIVLAHCSTAISYAILYKKPLVFLLSDEYIRSFDNYTPSLYAKKINSPCFNIDDKDNYSKIKNVNLFKVDKKKYKMFKDDYIKYPKRSDKKFWELFNEKI